MGNYIKQGFSSGQILKAEHLNHIEDGITDCFANGNTELTLADAEGNQYKLEIEDNYRVKMTDMTTNKSVTFGGNAPCFRVQVIDGSAIIPNMLQCSYSAKEVGYFTANGGIIERIVMHGSNNAGTYFSIGEETEKEKDTEGNQIKYIRHIKFPNNLSDIDIDMLNNTMTLASTNN